MLKFVSYTFFCTYSFQPEFRVRGAITRIFKAKFEGAWKSWGNVDAAMKDVWFSDFKVLYAALLGYRLYYL